MTIAPGQENLSETMRSLEYATRASQIKNQPKSSCKSSTSGKECAALKQENQKLLDTLAKERELRQEAEQRADIMHRSYVLKDNELEEQKKQSQLDYIEVLIIITRDIHHYLIVIKAVCCEISADD